MILAILLLCTGCGLGAAKEEKIRDLEMTVVSDEVLTEELKGLIEERKENPFQFTYTDGDSLYIVIGYGKQETGGYSIAVNALYETKSAICVSTTLLGPKTTKKGTAVPSYPYIVIRTKDLKLPVLMNE